MVWPFNAANQKHPKDVLGPCKTSMMERFSEYSFSEKTTLGSILAHFHQKFCPRTLMTKFYFEIFERQKYTKLYFQLTLFLKVLTNLTIINFHRFKHMLKLRLSTCEKLSTQVGLYFQRTTLGGGVSNFTKHGFL